MPGPSTPVYRFGDLLALARQSWIAGIASGLAQAGYGDYRRSDAATVRLLARGPATIGRLGEALGVTRQAARKVADGLVQRGFATVERDVRDRRQVNVALTEEGVAYARAVVAVVERMNRELCRRVAPEDLAGADSVLRAVLHGERAKRVAVQIAPPSS